MRHARVCAHLFPVELALFAAAATAHAQLSAEEAEGLSFTYEGGSGVAGSQQYGPVVFVVQ